MTTLLPNVEFPDLSNVNIPEGYILLPIIFLFPYLLARKGLFNAEKVIHEYMRDTENMVQTLINKFRSKES